MKSNRILRRRAGQTVLLNPSENSLKKIEPYPPVKSRLSETSTTIYTDVSPPSNGELPWIISNVPDPCTVGGI